MLYRENIISGNYICIEQILFSNISCGISSTCHQYERCEITELVLHKFQVLVEFNCLMLLSITTLGHDLFCEFVCFLRCIHRISWNDPSTCVYCGRHIFWRNSILYCNYLLYEDKCAKSNWSFLMGAWNILNQLSLITFNISTSWRIILIISCINQVFLGIKKRYEKKMSINGLPIYLLIQS